MTVSDRSMSRADPERVMRIGGVMMLVLLMMPLAFWLQKSLLVDNSVPRCDAGAVLKELRTLTSVRHPLDAMDPIRDIHSVGFDAQIGHRICMATLGHGAHARQVKFAISHRNSSPPILRVEAVSD
ncbi:hypothetical protein [Alcanivorax sp. 1008]|uniref:hypothetical protein n=1 Tax=Alcanivorax sp. 1008 TaxID=2816853 RepID=UPI001DA6E300|nr:hypothetical protein [Alcanivorax sp. 1008]MCC1497381.1 hypothetical protein [Alcanivorax sp. 1008]